MVFVRRGAGFDAVKRRLVRDGFMLRDELPFNNDGKGEFRHLLVKTDHGVFYCLFKHNFFMSFNYQFPDFVKRYPEFAGVGESINMIWLKKAMSYDAMLVYVYEDERIYTIKAKELWDFVNTHSLIRFSNQVPKELEAVFPIKKLERW